MLASKVLRKRVTTKQDIDSGYFAPLTANKL